MTNDYMPKATLQNCPEALKGIIRALLHVDSDFDLRENAIRRKEYYDALSSRDRKINKMDATISELWKQIAKYENT